jgi:hypothetical protein
LIAYKLLTGSPYWNATSVAGIIGQVLYEAMVPPSERGCTLGPEFDQWFLRACHRYSPRRFGSATEQIEALAKTLGLPFDARPDTLRSNPGDSGNALGERSLGGLSAPKQPGHGIGASSANKDEAATIAQSGTLVSSSKEMPDVRIVTPTRRRRTVFYAVMSAAALSSIAVVLLYRREPVAAPILVVKPAAPGPDMASEAAAAMVPAIAPEPSQIAPVEPPPSPKTALAAPLTPASATKRRELPKPAPGKGVASAAPARPDKALINDPLGDQK